MASVEEIKRIESECSIQEEDEDEEMDEGAEDAILFGDADEDDANDKKKDEEKKPEALTAKRLSGRLSISAAGKPVLTPVDEEKTTILDGEKEETEKVETKGAVSKPAEVMKSAGLTPKKPDEAVEDEEPSEEEEDDDDDEEDDDDDDEDDEEEVKAPVKKTDTTVGPKKQPASPKAVPPATGTTAVDSSLAKDVSKVKIEDQEATEGKHASISVAD